MTPTQSETGVEDVVNSPIPEPVECETEIDEIATAYADEEVEVMGKIF